MGPKAFAIAVVGLAVLIAGLGCSAATNNRVAAGVPKPMPPEQVLPVDKNGAGQLQGVSVLPSGSIALVPGTADTRANSRFAGQVQVGIPDSVYGVQATLLVPMWYSTKTTLTVLGQPRLLTQAVANRDIVWQASPNARVTYHIEDGVFVLDSLVQPPAH